jgi:hypothetical protein
MELAIPLVALGSMYIMNKQTKEPKPITGGTRGTEGFELPNTNVPDKNYPVATEITAGTSKLSTTNIYSGPSAYTDKYFQSPTGSQPKSSNEYKSLSGQSVDSAYFQHNNMVPFFGGKMRSAVDPVSNEAIMDNYLGSGSQSIKKSEQSPLFAPNEKIEWAHGAPNMNDFYQSRVNPSGKMSGVKPFEEIRVGPGLGLGASNNNGQGGYNSGTMNREQWMPKSVDELRTANKQKASEFMILGHEGPAKSRQTNVGIIGAVQKNRPDTAFEWGSDRLFTTTGAVKGPTMNAIQVERYVTRPETTTDYTGSAVSVHSQQAMPGEVLPSHRMETGPVEMGVANAVGRGFGSEGDFGKKSLQSYANNRSSNTQSDYFGAVGSSLGAVVAPLLEMMRPSKKENLHQNMRVYGDAQSKVKQGYLYNPNDAPAHTMRETTEKSLNHWNQDRGQSNNGYLSTPVQAVGQHRDSTHSSYTGSAGYSNSAPRTYDAELSYVPGDTTAPGRYANGNAKMFNNSINYQGKPKDLDMVMNRDYAPTNLPYMTHSVESMGAFQQNGQSRVSSVQMERNTPDMYSVLQQNPYALKKTFK